MFHTLGKWIIRSVLIVILVGLIIGGVIYWAFYMREHHRWSEDLKLWNAETLHVQQHMSRIAYHGMVGHFSPFWWGGGDWRYEMRFTSGGIQYHWECKHTPIAVQPDEDGTVYIVVYDRESDEARKTFGHMFRIYRGRGGDLWDEIAPEEFPKHLAIQNRECNECSDGGEDDRSNILGVIARMDPSEDRFRLSLNASLWGFLEDRNDETIYPNPRSRFLQNFKDRWIRPIGK